MSDATNSNTAPSASENSAKTSNKEQIDAHIDLAIVLALYAWPALTVAVQNTWGGPDSSEKRDWLAGVISDLFQCEPETDQEDVEVVLLQVMADEFEVHLEDSSEEIVAKEIMSLRQQCLKGEFGEVKTLQKKWEEKQLTGGDAAAVRNLQVVENKEEDEDSSDEGEDEGDEDVEMGDAPQSGSTKPPKEKVVPEVDEDGFTTVVSKKKR